MRRVIFGAFLVLGGVITPPITASTAFAQTARSEPVAGFEYGPFSADEYNAIIATSAQHGNITVSQKEGPVTLEVALKRGIAEFVKNGGTQEGNEAVRRIYVRWLMRAFREPKKEIPFDVVEIIATRSPSLYSFMYALAKTKCKIGNCDNYNGYVNIIKYNNQNNLKTIMESADKVGKKLGID